MQNNNIIKNTLSKFKENELIFASKLYKTELYNKVTDRRFCNDKRRIEKDYWSIKKI